MNQKHITSFVVVVATLLATNHCSAKQQTTFGTIQTAAPLAQSSSELPPIVSGESDAWRTGEVIDSIPAMVTPDKYMPAVRKPMGGMPMMGQPTQGGLPPIVPGTSEPKTSPSKMRSRMLAPIKLKPKSTPAAVDRSEVRSVAPSTHQAAIAPPAPPIVSVQPNVPPVVQAGAAIPGIENSQVQQAAQWGTRAAPVGFSRGGVKIYQDAEVAPGVIGELPTIVDESTMQSVLPQGQSLPPIISSDSQMVAPADTMIGPTAVPVSPAPTSSVPMGSSVMPMSVQPMAVAPSMPTIQSEIGVGQTYIQPPVTAAPVIVDSGCNGCGSSACGGSCGQAVSTCQSCGSGGCYSEQAVASQFGCCGSVCSARRYVVAEALYWDRDDGVISNSNFGALSNFDWNWGWRVTLGNRSDATTGREFSYMGISPLEQTSTRTDAGGRLNARFIPSNGFTGVESTAFRNAVSQSEFKQTRLHSLEFNRVRWGWDVVKSFIGLRYNYVDDEYRMTSINNVGEPGLFTMDAINNMFGPQIGGELFYDVGYRLSSSFAWKAGGYVNFSRLKTTLDNAGLRFLDAQDENVTLAGSLEASLIGHYQLSQQARLRFGYNVLWLGNVASVSDNYSTNLTPLTGTNTSDSDDMFFHGVSFGFEAYR